MNQSVSIKKELSIANSDNIDILKKGIWLYFLLIIFEGALRKWILPGLATPLLVVRDPLALWIIYTAWKRKLLVKNVYLGLMVLIGIVSIYTAVFFGHGSLPVAIYGARVMLLHFPIMFVIGRSLDRSDVVKIGRVTVYLAIPMVVLIGLQFYSPQSAFINRGVGGDIEGAGFDGAMGFFRPPGTFSFTNGNALFFSFLTTFVFYFWFNITKISRIVLILATISLFFSIPLSISRSLLFQVLVSALFVVIVAIRNPRYFYVLISTFVGTVAVLAILIQTEYFSIASEAFGARFESANRAEGGLSGVFLDRFLGGLINSITESNQVPFLGYGTGMGTNVGSMILTGETTFLIAEGEWGRLIGELGVFLGLCTIFLRACFTINLTVASFCRIAEGDFLPWFLLSFGFLNILQGQWAQPTVLGFSTLVGGLVMAAFNERPIPQLRY